MNANDSSDDMEILFLSVLHTSDYQNIDNSVYYILKCRIRF